jgi:hypothetical protein
VWVTVSIISRHAAGHDCRKGWPLTSEFLVGPVKFRLMLDAP